MAALPVLCGALPSFQASCVGKGAKCQQDAGVPQKTGSVAKDAGRIPCSAEDGAHYSKAAAKRGLPAMVMGAPVLIESMPALNMAKTTRLARPLKGAGLPSSKTPWVR